MPGWTQEDVDLRNLRIFGRLEPANPVEDESAKDIPEQQIALECEQLLREDDWRVIPCEPISDRTRGRGFGEAGMPDLLALRYSRQIPGACECLWIEWKAPGGRVQKHQLEWHTKERARGARTLIAGVDFAPTVRGFMNWYGESGLARAGAARMP
jgi:hypothetical protein